MRSVTEPTPSPTPGRRPPTIPFLPGVEGLRGLALLAVLLYHNGFSWAQGGFLGVSTFFTLSGFLITLLLIWEFSTTGPDQPAGLLGPALPPPDAGLPAVPGRRASLFGATVATPGQLASLRGDVISALAYVANWHFIFTGQSYAQLFSAPVAGAALLVARHRGAVLPGVPGVDRGHLQGVRRARGGRSSPCWPRLSAAVAGRHVGALHPGPGRDPRVLRHRHASPRAPVRRAAGPGARPPHRVRAAHAPLGLGGRRRRRRRWSRWRCGSPPRQTASWLYQGGPGRLRR